LGISQHLSALLLDFYYGREGSIHLLLEEGTLVANGKTKSP